MPTPTWVNSANRNSTNGPVDNFSWKLDNVKTFLAILLVFVSGILPIYLN